jgi:putative aldouronate transport system permease protein
MQEGDAQGVMLLEKFLKEIGKNKTLYLMAAPGMAVTLLMSYIPMSGIVLAFKNYRYDLGILGSPWAANFGFDNFRFFFISGTGFRVTMNTILYNLMNMAATQTLAITVALLLCEARRKWFKKIAQSVIFLPYFISWTVVGAFVYNIFDSKKGWFNQMVTALGGAPVDIYLIPWAWVLIICFFNAWKWVGYGSVIYIAAIAGIDTECYEAADLDGATASQKIRYITLPGIKSTVVIILLLNLGRILRGDFQMFYQIIGNNGQLFRTTDVIDTFVFRSLINSGDMAMTAAAAFYQSFFCFAIISTVNALIKRFEPDYALF